MKRVNRLNACLSCLLSSLLALPLTAPAGADQADAPPHRPRIGLVLAGGGAKGGAHVGALKVIEALHVPIDCIAGTSMGALIGAGYASGLSAVEIERFIKGIDWTNVVGGIGRRRLEPIEQKRLSNDANSSIQVGVVDRRIVTPSGLADASAIDDLLRTYVAQSRTVEDFDQLPIPFRAVATDMLTGEMVVLDHGDLATALRASMAIPGAFSPVELDPYILSDGGMVRNIPVDVARNTCADIVIVVNLVEPPPTREKLVQAQQLLSRSMDVMFEVNEKQQLRSLTDRDILISVPTGDIGSSDFDRVPETIPLGEAAARKQSDRLAALAVPEAEYLAWRQRIATSQGVEATVAEIRIEGLERVNPDYLRSMMAVRPGASVKIDDISADARQLSALEELDTVAYRLEGSPDATTLVWLPKEISIGSNVLRPSLGLFADGSGDFRFLMGMQHVRHWVNSYGAQWRNTLQLGNDSLLSTSFYQPLNVAQDFFVEPGLFGSRTEEDLYVEGDRVAAYEFLDYGGRLDFGWNASRYAQLRAGYVASERKTNLDTGLPGLPNVNARDAGIAVTARYDSRDTPTFSTKGYVAAVEYYRIDESFGADRNWERLEGGFRTAIPIGRNLVWVSVAGGTDLGSDVPGDRAFSLGGPRVLPAFHHDELRVGDYWLAESSFLWRLKDLVPLKNQAIYGGFGLQVVGVSNRLDVDHDETILGAYSYLAGPTPLGTFTLGFAAASNEWNVWLSIGRPIGEGSILDNTMFR